MHSIEHSIRSITEDQRAGYLFQTKLAAQATGMVPNKFGDWWRRTQGKLIDLGQVQPAELATELAMILAIVERERQRRNTKS